ncbi:MAG: hypothetical protein LBU79_02340 [Planctomycetota bacterium]|jgi:MraZ protein|nr:hypothetical protein [Planctomycetota bacterium]
MNADQPVTNQSPRMSPDSPYYYGSSENRLNSKGQVAIPARFRLAAPEEDQRRNYVLVRGETACLYLYTHRQFGRIKDNVKRLAEGAGDGEFYRRFMAETQAVDLDTQGRFVVPATMLAAVGIAGPRLLFIGMDDRIEIWDPDAWQAASGDSANYEDTRRREARQIFGI